MYNADHTSVFERLGIATGILPAATHDLPLLTCPGNPNSLKYVVFRMLLFTYGYVQYINARKLMVSLPVHILTAPLECHEQSRVDSR